MTDAALVGRVFEPPNFRPAWLRPAAISLVVALHAIALSSLPYLERRAPAPLREVLVDIEPEAAPTPEPPAPASPPGPQNAREEATAPPPELTLPPPQDVAPPSPPEPAPTVIEAQPAEPPAPSEPTSPMVNAAPPPEPAPLPAAVALPAPKPPPPVAPPRPLVKPAPRLEPKSQLKPEPIKPERVMPRAHERQALPGQAPRPAQVANPALAALEERPSASPSAPASAASQSAYVSAMSAAIRSRLFYPPAARARGAKGVVGVAFTISASGALSSFAITHSSGDEDLDTAARTLVQSAHFPPPPGGSVHVSTSFNYVPR